MPRRLKIFLPVALVSLALDHLTKVWARAALTWPPPWGPGGETQVMGDWFALRLSFNRGSAFGLFQGARWILFAIAIAACVAIVIYLKKASDRQTWFAAALGLVFGGALGNAVDRVIGGVITQGPVGAVTDFIVWRAGKYEWPAFNIADAALVVGVAILFIDAGREEKAKKRAQAEEAASEARSKRK